MEKHKQAKLNHGMLDEPDPAGSVVGRAKNRPKYVVRVPLLRSCLRRCILLTICLRLAAGKAHIDVAQTAQLASVAICICWVVICHLHLSAAGLRS